MTKLKVNNLKFSIDKKEIRDKLGMAQDKFIVFIMNGGVGFGDTAKLIQNLCKANVDFEVISVCGKNKKLKERIDKYSTIWSL